jgi:hypothetical protein
LHLERVYCDAVLKDNEPKEASSGDTEYTLERIQADILLMTPVNDNA